MIRQALVPDIPAIQVVRNAVLENRLSNPALVPDADVDDYISRRGRGWVSETNGLITGFSIVSVLDHNVWALFVRPGYDRQGLGRQLHDIMLAWYFQQTSETIWLSTAPGTRAEGFYRQSGWVEKGVYGQGEILFEMTAKDWEQRSFLTKFG